MTAVIATILGVLIVGGLAGYFLYKRYALKMIAQKA
jgi:LPXTG-motif cell wall-anchored protein